MGSTTMAFKQILVPVLLGCVAGQNSRTFPSLFGNSLNSLKSGVEEATSVSTTPVPILKFLDVHNNDGSYTYGYESADGTFKIETRSVTESGFVPVVDGREYNPAANYAANNAQIATNTIDQPASTVNSAPVSVPRRQHSFGNLLPLAEEPTQIAQPTQIRARSFNSPRTKTVNGRRVLLKKRVRNRLEKATLCHNFPRSSTSNNSCLKSTNNNSFPSCHSCNSDLNNRCQWQSSCDSVRRSLTCLTS